MAHNTRGTESSLREYLLAEAIEFRHQMCSMLAENPAWSSQAWVQLSHAIDVLDGGESYRLHGWELPDDHSARILGVNVDFILDDRDVLRVLE